MSLVQIQKQPRFPGSFFRRFSSLAVLADENTQIHCYRQIKNQLPDHKLIVIPPGEQYKNLDTCRNVWQSMTEAQLDRHSLLLVLGGGVVGDLGGFCASTFKRGIPFVLVPTTLLAMADASIGGKTGIDYGPLKNHLGTFTQPAGTWIATSFLDTLPEPQLRSGFAEIIKHTILSDPALWKTIRKKPFLRQDWASLVRKSVAFKSSVVRKDPRESGMRKILNFGHTIGHALEGHALQAGNPQLHGEAIAAGMVMESIIALKKGMLKQSVYEEIRDFVHLTYGRIHIPGVHEWIGSMIQDKKNKGNRILMALPSRIGKAVFDIPVSDAEIRAAAAAYGNDQM